jgi:hypothetical protein
MRYAIIAAAILLAGCQPPQVSGSAVGGVVNYFGHEPPQAVASATTFCQGQGGRGAIPRSFDTTAGGRFMTFECVR